MHTAIGFEHFQTAIENAKAGKSFDPKVTIDGVTYSFYKPTLQDIDVVTKDLMAAGFGGEMEMAKVAVAGIEMFADIHMKMEMQDPQGRRAVQKADLDKLENQAHVNLFRNLYVSLCLFFILRSDGYTITF